MRALEAVTIVFACAVPVASIALTSVLWLVPLEAPSQTRVLALAELAYGWASLDVFLVALVAAATQLGAIAETLARGRCAQVDGVLEAFFDRALDGDNTCFRMAVRIKPGCVLLAIACVLQMALGFLAANVTTAAVAERANAHAAAQSERRQARTSSERTRAHAADDGRSRRAELEEDPLERNRQDDERDADDDDDDDDDNDPGAPNAQRNHRHRKGDSEETAAQLELVRPRASKAHDR